MLARCEAQQWRVEDLDWEGKPRAMPREEEIAVVRNFKDVAGIERFAAALFEEQGRVVADPTLQNIFSTFVVDEGRHAVAAERLAAYYDVRHYE